MALSSFLPSSSGLAAQSHALGQVSTNIANMNTTGYRSNQTMFHTLLGSSPIVKGNNSGISSSRTDTAGLNCYDRTNILKPGEIEMTGNGYDVAIDGISNAFFMVKDPANNTYYSRAGDFSTRTENGITYLVNSSGFKVQGFTSTNGGDEFGIATEDIVIKHPESVPPTPTQNLSVTANVPASGVDTSSYTMTIYATTHDGENLHMHFDKIEGKNNAWELSFDVEGGTATGSVKEVIFNGYGEVVSPKVLDVAINWDDGDTNNIHLNISTMTQLAGGPGLTFVEQDGATGGMFVESHIDKDGVVKASYSNGETHSYGKLALISFTSPENLTPINGTLFEANAETGETHYLTQKDPLKPQSLEMSAVDVEKEFSNMIIIQRAYSMNTQSFTANNEMLELLVDLKS